MQSDRYSTNKTHLSSLRYPFLWGEAICNPHYTLELRNEELNSNKSGSFIDFSIAPLWLNQKTHKVPDLQLFSFGIDFLVYNSGLIHRMPRKHEI